MIRKTKKIQQFFSELFLIVNSIPEKLQKIDEVQKIYFANQTPTQPNESYKVGWIPLTSNYPKWNNLIYEEWIKLYHRQLERDLSD